MLNFSDAILRKKTNLRINKKKTPAVVFSHNVSGHKGKNLIARNEAFQRLLATGDNDICILAKKRQVDWQTSDKATSKAPLEGFMNRELSKE